jgi:lipoyl-dependent peroxiredoxin
MRNVKDADGAVRRAAAGELTHHSEELTMPTRKAGAIWEGGLKTGRGRFSGTEGGVSGPYTFGSRFEEGAGSNPEELLAAAQAACFSMALSASLERAGHKPQRIETDAAATLEKVGEGFSITRVKLTVRGDVPGIDAEEFRKAAEATGKGCIISRALNPNIQIDVDASLA